MVRTVCIWIPQLELRSRIAQHEQLDISKPLLLADAGSLKSIVQDATWPAQQAGVRPQMPLAVARTLCPEALLIAPDAQFLQKKRQQLLQKLYQLAPIVGHDQHESLFIDCHDVASLYRDEQRLATAISELLAPIALAFVVVFADTPLDAWVIAHATEPPPQVGVKFKIVATGSSKAVIDQLPTRALLGAKSLQQAFDLLGLQRVADLRRLPPGALMQRFGRQGQLLQEQINGDRIASQRLFIVQTPAQPPEEQLFFDQPQEASEPLLFIGKSLLERLLRQVALQRRVVALLEIKLVVAAREIEPIIRQLRAATPTLNSRIWLDLIAHCLTQLVLPAAVEGLCLRAVELGHAERKQLQLFTQQQQLTADAVKLGLSKLAAAFGSEAVAQPQLISRHIPESSLAWQAISDIPQSPTAVAPTNPAEIFFGQPEATVLALFNPPREIHFSHGGRTLRIEGEAQSTRLHDWQGPYRLDVEWWRSGGIKRSYWLVTDQYHQMSWIYRDCAGRFWLQAYLD